MNLCSFVTKRNLATSVIQLKSPITSSQALRWSGLLKGRQQCRSQSRSNAPDSSTSSCRVGSTCVRRWPSFGDQQNRSYSVSPVSSVGTHHHRNNGWTVLGRSHTGCMCKTGLFTSNGHARELVQRRGFRDSNYVTLEEKWKTGDVTKMENLDQFGDIEDKIFDYLCDSTGKLHISKFKHALLSTGLRETDPRLKECMQALSLCQAAAKGGLDGLIIDRETFKQCISKNLLLITKAFRNHFIIPDFQNFSEQIDSIYWKTREAIGGKEECGCLGFAIGEEQNHTVATYIPQLARYSPNYWGVSVCTVDGQRYSLGDVNVPFCLQSVSKPLTYAMVLDELSSETVHQYVGHEPSGQSFNNLSLDYKDKPHNPMLNAGGIMLCSLLKPECNLADRFDFATQRLKKLAGGEYLAFNNSVFLSERETADRNFAIGYYMREKKCFPEGTNLMEVLDFYFQLCSVEVTCESGAVIAATLANGGICPITGEKVFSSTSVRDTLSLMHSCGMYDYSGEFAFRVGLPAKSGVSGVIFLIVPNKMGFCMWSPALDSWGNSVRGVQFCQELVASFNFHNYDNLKFTQKKVDPCHRKIESRATDVVSLLFSAYNCDVSALRRFALRGVDMEQKDYDGRTALHIGAAEGHTSVVEFLIHKCKCSPFVVDRWGFTPLDDAKRFGHTDVVKILMEVIDVDNSNVEVKRSR